MRHKKLLIGALALLAILVWLWLKPEIEPKVANRGAATASNTSSSPAPSVIAITPKNPQLHEERRKAFIENIVGALGTPVTFYGRVIDQNNAPVPFANATYGTIDRFDASGSSYSSTSDADGFFSITGIKGAVLTVGVRKDGYYPIHNVSNGSFAYGVSPDSHRRTPPTKENPAVFKLQKMGETEPLIKAGGGQINIPQTGNPLSINLNKGKAGVGDLQIQTWVSETSQDRFDWRLRLSVQGGGIIERKNQFDFEAPLEGYNPFIEINMPRDASKWSSDFPKECFVKLADGRYARFSLRYYAGGLGDRNFIVFESYLNPKPGSRNLEYDPVKAIKAP